MVAYVLRQWRTMSTLDVCRPSISSPSRDCCSMEVIPAIRWQRTEPFQIRSKNQNYIISKVSIFNWRFSIIADSCIHYWNWLSLSYNYRADGLTYDQPDKLTIWLAIGLSAIWLIGWLTLTGLTLSSRGMPLLCTAWNCNWLNSVAILSRIWPANKGLYTARQTNRHQVRY